MISKIGYLVYYITSWIVWALPLRVAYTIADILYIIIYKIGRYRVKVVRENLKNAFPEKSEQERKNIERKFYLHLCDFFVETMQVMHMRESEIKRRFKYLNVEIFENYINQGRSVITVMGHYGNWELNIGFPLWFNCNSMATYKPLNSSYFNYRMQKSRERFGLKVISMRQTAKKMLEYSNKGVPTILALIADQAPMNSESDFWIKFLNQNTAIFLGPEKIARKIDAPVVFLDIQKVKRGYYNVTIQTIVEDSCKTADGEITKAHVRKLEEQIRNKPEYWLWSHRRWKRKMPKEAQLQSIYE